MRARELEMRSETKQDKKWKRRRVGDASDDSRQSHNAHRAIWYWLRVHRLVSRIIVP